MRPLGAAIASLVCVETAFIQIYERGLTVFVPGNERMKGGRARLPLLNSACNWSNFFLARG